MQNPTRDTQLSELNSGDGVSDSSFSGIDFEIVLADGSLSPIAVDLETLPGGALATVGDLVDHISDTLSPTTLIAVSAITDVGGTARFTATGHGLKNGAFLEVSGNGAYDGDYYVSLIDENSFELLRVADGTTQLFSTASTSGAWAASLLTAWFDGTARSIELIDLSTGAGTLGVSIANTESLASFGLGILTTDIDGDGVLIGSTLVVDSLSDYFFLVHEPGTNVPSISGSIDLDAPDIDVALSAGGRFGLAKIGIENGSGGAHSTLSVSLADPDSDGRLTLSELFSGLNDPSTIVASPQFTGGIDQPFVLPVQASLFNEKQQIRLIGQPTGGHFVLSWDNGSGPEFLLQLAHNALASDVQTALESHSQIESGDVRVTGGSGGPWTVEFMGQYASVDVNDLALSVNNLAGGLNPNATIDVVQNANALGGSPQLTISWPDFTDPSSLAVTGIQELLNFEFLGQSGFPDFDDILNDAFGFLTNLEQFSFLNEKLPVINRSLSELLGLGGSFTSFVNNVQSADVRTLDALHEALATALNSALGPDSIVKVSLDESISGKPALKIELDIDQSYQDTLSVNLDLSDIVTLPAVGSLLDVGGAATFAIAGGADVDLDIGIDLSDPADPRAFVYNTTQATVSAQLNSSDLNFSAAFGPLGVSIGNGSSDPGRVAFDVDGLGADGLGGSTSDATWTASLQNFDADGRLYISSNGPQNGLGSEDFVIPAPTAGFGVRLPVYFQGNSVDAINVKIADLNNIGTSTQITTGDFASSTAFDATPFLNAFSSIDLGGELGAMVDGWDGFFMLLEDALDGEVFGFTLPVIGDQLKDAGRFVSDIRTRVVDNLKIVTAGNQDPAFVQQRIFEALGPGGLGWLVDVDDTSSSTSTNPDNQLTRHDVRVLADGIEIDPIGFGGSPNEVQFDLRLRNSLTALEIPVDFDLGLPGLGFEIDEGSSVAVEVGFELAFGFGIDKDDGVYFDTSKSVANVDGSPVDLVVDVQASLPNLSATGELGFLQLDIVDDGTLLAGRFGVDITSPDDRLTFAELSSTSPVDLIEASFNTDTAARVDLDLVASFGGNANFPSIASDFVVEWMFNDRGTTDETLDPEDKPSVRFENVTLQVGEFFNNYVTPVIAEINSVLDPARPIVDFLTAPLPIVSDLAGTSIDLIDVGKYYARDDQDVVDALNKVEEFVEGVKQVLDLLNVPVVDGNLVLPIGTFDLTAGMSEFDPRIHTLQQIGIGAGDSPTVEGETVSEIKAIDEALLNASIPSESEILGMLGAADPAARDYVEAGEAVESESGKGLRFPILKDPKSAFRLLLGQDVDLLRLDLPTFDAGYAFIETFPLIPPFLDAFVGGSIGVSADFDFGFDTRGLRQFAQTGVFTDVFNGFFLDDHIVDGVDQPEITLEAGLFVGAQTAPIPIFPPYPVFIVAGAGGGLFAEINLDLADKEPDGKVHFDELGDPRLFDVSGELAARLFAFLEIQVKLGLFSITVVDVYADILDVTLLRFENSDAPVPRPVLGQMENGVLYVNAGETQSTPGGMLYGAAQRGVGDLSAGTETFGIRPGSNSNEVIISSLTESQTFSGVSSVVFRGGSGVDTVVVHDNVVVPVEIHGGAGDDVLMLGDGPGTVFGGEGNDRIMGGPQVDFLYGGLGDDKLWGGNSDDMLDGGAGVDEIYGGGGNDHLIGGEQTDYLYGEAGVDTIEGGTGVDYIYGGLDGDVLMGGSGDDTIRGDQGADTIEGGAGNDDIEGGEANDTIHGGDDNDTIDGGLGFDSIWGDGGHDTIQGGPNSDNLFGGTGDDVIYASWMSEEGVLAFETNFNHTIDGGEGDDLIHGDGVDGGAEEGVDTIFGSAGNDTIFAYAGNDIIQAGSGDDYVDGGEDADLIQGDADNDTLLGQLGTDTIFGGGGDDVIEGGAEDDFLVGNLGDDQIFGNEGRDIIFGGVEAFGPTDLNRDNNGSFETPSEWAAADADFAEFALPAVGSAYDFTLLMPALVADLPVEGLSNDGRDFIRGGAQTDWIFGGGDQDDLDGQEGADYVDGGAGNDLVSGGPQADIVRGGGNDDILHGDQGIDLLLGDDGADNLFGDEGETGLVDPGNNNKDISQQGQRLFGGGGIDFLFAYAPVIISTQEVGDQLFGGAGGDFLYGNIRQEFLAGEGGNDTLLGDYLIGPNYATNTNADTVGADDVLRGGTGEDQLFGGGASDNLRGGSDSDWLEGQDGRDFLAGDAGIDMLVIDTSALYSDFGDDLDGHFGLGDAQSGPDDNATDIALIEGSTSDDVIRVSEEEVGITGFGPALPNGALSGETIAFDLTIDDGTQNPVTTPVSFVTSATSLDELVSDLGDALPDGVGVTADRTSDRIRIQSEGLGPRTVLQVSGLNATALDELRWLEGQESVRLLNVAVNGTQVTVNWRSLAGDPIVEQLRLSGLSGDDTLEFVQGDTSVDISSLVARSDDFVGVLDGGPGADLLLGTEARDRLDGGSGSDVVFGFGGDDRIWGDSGIGDPTDNDILYAGTGNDDLIGGQGTNRLFAWSVNPYGPLGFDATPFSNQAAEIAGIAPALPNGTLTNVAFAFDLEIDDSTTSAVTAPVSFSSSATSLDELAADLDAALPTGVVADRAGDQIRILTDGLGLQTKLRVSNLNAAALDELRLLEGQESVVRLTAQAQEVENGKILRDARFRLTVGTDAPVEVFLAAATTSDNNSIADLVDDLNSAIEAAFSVSPGDTAPVLASANAVTGALELTTTAASALQFEPVQFGVFVDPAGNRQATSEVNLDLSDPADLNRFLGVETTASGLAAFSSLAGLSVDTPSHLDRLRFTVTAGALPDANDSLTLRHLGGNGSLLIEVVELQPGGSEVVRLSGETQRDADSAVPVEIALELNGLTAAQYEIRVSGAGDFPHRYEILPEVDVNPANDLRVAVDLSVDAEDTGLNRMLGSSQQDLLFGGTSLDFLFGNGSSESAPDQLYNRRGELFVSVDQNLAGEEWKEYARQSDHVWYYGGTNNDDQISVDLVTEPGLFQNRHLITRLTGNNGNFTFDAQVQLDFDAVDENGNPVWNPADAVFDWELTAGESLPLVDQVPLPANGQLSGNAVFFLSLYGRDPVQITVPVVDATAGTSDNTTTADLLVDINYWLGVAGLGDAVLASSVVERDVNGTETERLRLRISDNFVPTALERAENPLVVAGLNSVTVTELGLLLGQQAVRRQSDEIDVQRLLPPEDDFLAIVIDALGGDDVITIGPTVTKSIWADGGADNDIINVVPGQPILVDQTEKPARNDTPASAFTLPAPWLVSTSGISTGDIDLAAAAAFDIRTATSSDVTTVSIPAGSPARTLAEYVDAFNTALATTDRADEVRAIALGDELAVVGADTSAAAVLEVTSAEVTLGDPVRAVTFAQEIVYTGLTIDNAQDSDLYRLPLLAGTLIAPGTGLLVTSLSADDELTFDVGTEAAGVFTSLLATAPTPAASRQRFLDLHAILMNAGRLDGNDQLLATEDLVLKILTNQIPTTYQLQVVTRDHLEGVGGNDSLLTATLLDPVTPLGLITDVSLHTESDADLYRFHYTPRRPLAAQVFAAADIGMGNTVITIEEHGLETGDVVLYRADANAGALGGLTDGDKYYVIAVDSDRLKLAATVENADNDLPIIFGTPIAGANHQIEPVAVSDRVVLQRLAGDAPIKLEVLDASGTTLLQQEASAAFAANLAFDDLQPGEYFLRVSGTSRAEYELGFDVGDAPPLLTLEASSFAQTFSHLATPIETPRRDVLLGGTGDDRLSGGWGEEWIFGQAGNDVLNGGPDRQASDLLWGGDGDDTFQVIPSPAAFD